MQLIHETSEDEMIAVFLSGELDSRRFGVTIRQALARAGADEKLLREPDLHDSGQNRLRRKLLQQARGYGERTSWFAGLPDDIRWYRARLRRRELINIRYIVYDYWIELTGGSLRAGDAVATIRQGKEIFGVSNQPFWEAVRVIEQGEALPPMILLGTGAEDLIVLEGHLRLTAYLLAGDRAPETVAVLVGLSAKLPKWKMYSFDSYNRLRGS